MSQRRAPPFDKNDDKYRITSFCCLHVKYATRTLAIIFLFYAIFECVLLLKDYKADRKIEMKLFIPLAIHICTQLIAFAGVVGESKTALVLLMLAIGSFSIFFLINQLSNFQENVESFPKFGFEFTPQQVSILNGAKIILIVLLLIVHYYTCYISDKDRNRIVPIVYFDRTEVTATAAATHRGAADAAAVRKDAAATARLVSELS